MIRVAVTILCLLSCATAFAQPNGTEQRFRRLLDSASRVNKTIVCDFTQVKKVKKIKEPVGGHGRFYYDNAGKMALVYEAPAGDRIVMDGESFTITAAGKKMVNSASSNPMLAQVSYMMQASMSGDVSKLGRGWGMSIEEEEGHFRVRLTPTDRRIKKYISAMQMDFDSSDLTLDVLRIEEASGGFTEYTFSDKELNRHFDPSVFNAE